MDYPSAAFKAVSRHCRRCHNRKVKHPIAWPINDIALGRLSFSTEELRRKTHNNREKPNADRQFIYSGGGRLKQRPLFLLFSPTSVTPSLRPVLSYHLTFTFTLLESESSHVIAIVKMHAFSDLGYQTESNLQSYKRSIHVSGVAFRMDYVGKRRT